MESETQSRKHIIRLYLLPHLYIQVLAYFPGLVLLRIFMKADHPIFLINGSKNLSLLYLKTLKGIKI